MLIFSNRSTRIFGQMRVMSALPVANAALSDRTSAAEPVTKKDWVPGPKHPSTWWPTEPRSPGLRVVRMYPIRFRHRPRIVLVREGCTNRPFYTIQIKSNLAEAKQRGIEQVGSWDPFPNKVNGEQLVALNLNRIAYWLAIGAEPSTKVAELLGLAGFLPVHPRCYLFAHRIRLATRKYLEEKAREEKTEKSMAEGEKTDSIKEDTDSHPKARPDIIWRRNSQASDWCYWGLS
ncbi:unnamed protein product [Calicophoron daubneyi]|uniref:Small ribosomal subunit protein bS16m n=1 Tax=Calicophoron daubneyi TaxID=300641 RepID=A0AAV2T0I4_CALDB